LILRLVDRDYVMTDGSGGSVILDLNDGVNYAVMLDSFKPSPATARQSTSDSPFRDGTKYNPGLGKLEDVTLPFSIKCIGDAVVSAKEKADALLNEARRDTVYVLYAPDGDSDITFWSAHPAVDFDTDRFWSRFYSDRNIGVVDFELHAPPGFGTVETLVALENLAPNASLDNWTGVEIDDYTRTVTGSSTITKETTIKFHGSASVKMVRSGGLCYFTTTGFISVNPNEPFCLDAHVYSTAGLILSIAALCYDADDSYLDMKVWTGMTRGGTAWDRENMYLYHQGGYWSYYIRPEDWPPATAKVKLAFSLEQNGTVYVDKIIFANVKYVPDKAMDGVVGIVIPPGDIKGDLPALCDIYVSNPFTSPPWRLQDSGFYVGTIYGVCAFDSTHIWVVGQSGKILFYDGTSWVSQISGTSLTLRSVSAVSATVAWAVGNGGEIRKTTDGGATWVFQPSGSYGMNLYSVSAVNANVAWVVGEYGLILKTVNGGADWVQQYPDSGYLYLYSVTAIDANNAWAVGMAGLLMSTIIRTTDGGANWDLQDNQGFSDLYGVFALDSTHAWAVGYGGLILFWDGTFWWSQTSGTSNHLWGVYAADSTHVWVTCVNGTILFYNGSVWSMQSTGQTNPLYGLDGYSTTNIWATGGGNTILRGIYPPGALEVTDLVIGQRDGYHEDFNPVVECAEGTLKYNPYRRWGTYRELSATDVAEFLFNLAGHAGNRYAIAAGISFSASTTYDKGTIHLLLKTVDGNAITAQYLSDEIDLGNPNGKWKEVILLDDTFEDADVSSHLVSDDAMLGNIDQVIEVIANASLGAVKLMLDYVALVPLDCYTSVGAIDSNYLIVDSTMEAVMDSIDGGPSTAMTHDPQEVTGSPRFVMDPAGVNMTLVAINDASDDMRVGTVNLTVRYRKRYKLHA
jgi:photosystem II stability/assembly factor-like uncharacterized protein